MKIPDELRERAIEAHRHRDGWSTFYRRNCKVINRLAPFSRIKHSRIVAALLTLVDCGANGKGQG